MSQESEPKEKKEMSPGSPMTQTSTVDGMKYPYQVLKIIQNIYTSAIPPQDQLYPTNQMRLFNRIIHIFNEIMNLTTKKLAKLKKMVKASSDTAAQSGEIIDFDQEAIALSIDRWEAFLEKVKIEEETEPEDTIEDKLSEILSRVRTMKKEEFEKVKSSIMGCPSFRTEADKLNLVELLTKVRSMPEKEFKVFQGMVKDSSVTLTAELIKEVEKTWKQLRQITIEQVDEVLEMVKNLSVI
jgi:hypothetical protein